MSTSPDHGVNTAAPLSDAAVVPDIAAPQIHSRIDPAQVITDWDVTGLCGDEVGPEGQFGRPQRSEYCRVHPEWSTGCYMIDCRGSQGLNAEYLLSHAVARALIREEQPILAAKVYLMAVHRGGYRFWPIKLGDPTEPRSPARHISSALAAVEAAKAGWSKIFWRNGSGKSGWAYRSAKSKLDEPEWPSDPLALFLEAIADRFIDQLDNPIIRSYCGEV